jgi:hypothetical protein
MIRYSKKPQLCKRCKQFSSISNGEREPHQYWKTSNFNYASSKKLHNHIHQKGFGGEYFWKFWEMQLNFKDLHKKTRKLIDSKLG